MALSYTVAECEARLAAIRDALTEISELPTRGNVGKTVLDHSQTPSELRAEEGIWLERLRAAHSGGALVAVRRNG